MKNIFSKANAPYLVSGASAIVTLLASGVLAVAPYVGFLAPVVALSLGLPFIVGGAIFSIAAIALSYAAVSKNNTISEEEAKVKAQQQEIAKKDGEISSLKKQLDENKSFYDAVDVQKEREARQEKFESRVARRKQEEAETLGSVSKIIELSDKETEAPSPVNQPTENSQSRGALSKAVGVLGAAALYYGAPYISTVLNEAAPSPLTNSTMCFL